MSRAIVASSQALAATDSRREYLVECALEIERPLREVARSWLDPSPWVEMEPTGQLRGTLDATVANIQCDPFTLISGGVSVFEWPDARCFVAVIITRISQTVPFGDDETRTAFHGDVVGVAEYADHRFPDAEARMRLGLPAKQLTPGEQTV
jgi:hypothetical protein